MLTKLKFIFLLLIFSFSISAQHVKDIYYNYSDTTWILQYHHMLAIRGEIENVKLRQKRLQEEIKLLEIKNIEKSIIIEKLELKDSLATIGLRHYEKMDSLLRDKLNRYDIITDNYKALSLSTQDQLDAEAKKARREKVWKNIYKYSYPAAIAIVGFIILKS